MIAAYASRSHYLEHLAPVWVALPEEHRGRFLVPNRLLEQRAEALGVQARRGVPECPGPLLVASHEDLSAASRAAQIIYLEHGSGQSYAGDARASVHPAYSGGRDRGQVALFLVPNEMAAARNRAAYPETPSVVIGSPLLDTRRGLLKRRDAGVLGITFHWDCYLCPETRSAWSAWKGMLRQIAEVWPGPVVGHAHPRLYPKLRDLYAHFGIQPEPEASTFLELCDTVAFDNTSLGYEAAALGCATVVLSAPWYRRDVSHGLRFWDLLPGPELDPVSDGVQAAEELSCAAMMSAHYQHWRDLGALVAAQVYPLETRGVAAKLAAEAIMERFG